MYKFNVSAPGRVFLSGYPSKYNEISIAASLNLRTTLAFISLPIGAAPKDFIEINLPNIMLHARIPLDSFLVHFNKEHFKLNVTNYDLNQCYKKIIDFVSQLREYAGMYRRNDREHQLALRTFFFLLALISYGKNIKIKSSIIVKISTEMTMAEGLGSSASFAVCLAACFYRWSLLQKGLVVYEFSNQHLMDILKYAQWCESLVYNSSSTIDAIVSVYGSLLVFDDNYEQFTQYEVPRMRILLVYSNVTQKTTIEQSNQMDLVSHFYPFTKFIQDSIKAIYERSIEVFGDIETKIKTLNKTGVSYDKDPDCLNLFERLLTLVNTNQGLLCALGMSHPNVDVICAIARDFSFAGKIVNNGGGGYAFILLQPNCTDELLQNFIYVLESHNFFAKITSLSCSGLTIE